MTLKKKHFLTSAGKESVVVRRPRDRLDSGDVLGKGVDGVQRLQVPHEQLVVVAAGGEVLVVGGPLKTAHFLPVADLENTVLMNDQ